MDARHLGPRAVMFVLLSAAAGCSDEPSPSAKNDDEGELAHPTAFVTHVHK